MNDIKKYFESVRAISKEEYRKYMVRMGAPELKKEEEANMDYNTMISRFKNMVADYTNEHLDKVVGVNISNEDVYVVWYSKTLKNAKALLSTPLHDGMYYEITYNGDKEEFYFDAYKKFENRLIK